MPPKILIVDDEAPHRQMLRAVLSAEGFEIHEAENGQTAIAGVANQFYDLILMDIRMAGLSGIEALKEIKHLSPGIPIIIMTAYASVDTAVEALKAGAYDYITKPLDIDELKLLVEKALQFHHLEQENLLLKERLNDRFDFSKIIGRSHSMQKVFDTISLVAPSEATVLITGESGTGKELIARSIHNESTRADQPFVAINCGGIPETLMESELFGHKKGAFTGASQDKQGLFEAAHNGTIFLDEIGELSMPLQVKLLRVVQEKVFKPVGGNEDINVDCRIISATNKNLAEEVIEGRFREDLFYRLNVIEIKVPPLRERKPDIKALAQHFLEKYANEMEKEIKKISSYAVDLLQKYDFPGNVRELENLMERSVALSTTNIILPESLALSVHKRRWIEGVQGKRYDLDDIDKGVSLDMILREIEYAYLQKALELTGGNKNKAAELLGITFRSFRHRLGKLQGDN